MPRILLVGILLALLLPAAIPAQAAPRCFPDVPGINACIDGEIAAFWAAQGGLPVFGYPLGPAQLEGGVTVQRFERARLEHHPENAAPYDVLLGRLGADLLAARGEPPATPEAPQAGCRHFPATGLNVCGAFLSTYSRYGLDLGQPGITPAESLALFGLPLTAPREERLADGQLYSVQWFERARFEDHGAQGVLLGLLGSEAGGTAAPHTPPTAAGLEAGGFIVAEGDRLTRLGRTVQLKGVNYYPQGRPWAEMWEQWDGPQIERELRAARDQLGINTVRILLPYDLSGSDPGAVGRRVISRMRQMTQIAGDLDLRLVVALFDFSEEFPAAGSQAEATQLRYLTTLLGNFSGDERILAWDLHNEPDNYEQWAEKGRAAQVLDWLGRMADAVHRLAPNHLVTVGMAHYEHLYAAGPDGRRPVDYSDLVSAHIYNADDAARQLDEVRRQTGKPILLGEFGWPTGPACAVPGYTEQEQERVYRTILDAARGRVAGVLAWSLRDFDAGPTYRWETREEHYGLVRPDGSLKPAAAFLQGWPAEPLPSTTRVATALTVEDVYPPGGTKAPLLIAESGHYVKGEFRAAYAARNGRYSFGPPLSEAFVRREPSGRGSRVVQYFSGALLAYYPEAAEEPGFAELPPEAQQARLIRPLNIGEQYLAAQGIAPQPSDQDDEFDHVYRALGGRWRFGAPISPKLTEQRGGVAVRVQYFQNGSLQTNPTTGAVEPGPLGTWAWEQQCAATR